MSSERQLDNEKNPWWGEHIHRYVEAEKLLSRQELNILDIACGSGFGSNFLALKGHHVIGADISEETIIDCKRKYQSKNLNFEVIDGTKIPFPDNYFDVIISFETIEHTTEFQNMLNEFKRVVKSDNGIILISTPNFLINSPDGVIINKYHTQEWGYEDFKNLLKSTFFSVQVFGQEYIRYKNKLSFRYRLASFFENTFYKRGIRKLPMSFQDFIINRLIHLPMYPISSDYILTEKPDEIIKCKTFFAICKP